MFKYHKKYEDYEGNVKEEDFYFNLNKAEILEMEISEEGGMGKRLQAIADSQDMKEGFKVLKGLLVMAYGVKEEDGTFVKSQTIRDRFMSSAAYGEILMDIATDADLAQKFVNGIVPNIPQAAPPVKTKKSTK